MIATLWIIWLDRSPLEVPTNPDPGPRPVDALVRNCEVHYQPARIDAVAVLVKLAMSFAGITTVNEALTRVRVALTGIRILHLCGFCFRVQKRKRPSRFAIDSSQIVVCRSTNFASKHCNYI
jgi:hypothetical protein